MRRIGFDAVRALRNTTGLGNYAREVLRGLRRSPAPMECHLYSPEAARPEYAGLAGELGASLHLPDGGWNAAGARSIWRTFRLGRLAAAHGLELYHGLSHEIPRDLPRTGIRSVVTFHDLIWRRFPEFFPAIDRWSYEWRYRWSAEHATAIIAVSRQTRRDLVELYGVDPARVTVVPPPVDPRFGDPVPAERRREILARYDLPPEFLLSVGTLTPRKNHRVLIEALAELDPAGTPLLVVVGRDRGSAGGMLRLAERLGVAERVRVRTDVADADLPAVMQSAALFLYPSRFEGFGLPIVEALAAGVPVIASSGGSFPEAGGPGTLYVSSGDGPGFAAGIRRVLDDGSLAERIRISGRRHAERFGHQALTARLVRVYDAVLGGGTLPPEEPVYSPSQTEHPECVG